jgi:hypothetical protein
MSNEDVENTGLLPSPKRHHEHVRVRRYLVDCSLNVEQLSQLSHCKTQTGKTQTALRLDLNMQWYEDNWDYELGTVEDNCSTLNH